MWSFLPKLSFPIAALCNCSYNNVADLYFIQLMQSQGKSLGRVYAETNFPTEQLGSFIRLCLSDGNFPGFVEAVEKEMNHLTGGK